jgi:hypothetical protein
MGGWGRGGAEGNSIGTDPELLNFLAAQESIPKIPPGSVAWRAGTATLFLLGS